MSDDLLQDFFEAYGGPVNAVTVNEQRRRLGLPPVQDGDRLLTEHTFTEAALRKIVLDALVPSAHPLSVDIELDTSRPLEVVVIVRSHGLLLEDFRRHFPSETIRRRKPAIVRVIGVLTRRDPETHAATMAAFLLGGPEAVGGVEV